MPEIIQTAEGWTVTADFEDGTVGEVASGGSGFHSAGDRTIYSNVQANTGNQSVRLDWLTGDDGFSNNRGEINFPETVGVGGEMWMRAYFYFEAGWDWGSANTSAGIIKMMRFHKQTSDGGHAGYTSMMGTSSGAPRGSNEGYQDVSWIDQNQAGQYIAPNDERIGAENDVILGAGQWYSLEIYTKLEVSGGVYRMWADGQLIAENTDLDIMHPGGMADFAFIMSTWNGGAPQDQTQFIDDFMVTTIRPDNQDSNGNYMIGMLEGSGNAGGGESGQGSESGSGSGEEVVGNGEEQGGEGGTSGESELVKGRVIDGESIDLTNISAESSRVTGSAQGDHYKLGSGNDTVSGFDGADVINGSHGADLVNGNRGNDYVAGGSGDDRVLGGRGHDEVRGGRDQDFVNGNRGHDVVHGDLGNDILHGGQHNDSIFGGEGNDIIFGDRGDDVLHGGAGNDVFTFSSGGGRDIISDFTIGQDRIDLVRLGFASREEALLNTSFAQGNTLINLGDVNGTIELVGIDASTLNIVGIII